MSTFAIEAALHDLGVKRQARTAFADDPDTFLAGYRLSPDERRMFKEFDVAAMQRAGASPLLTIGFWLMNEPSRARATYLARLNQNTDKEH